MMTLERSEIQESIIEAYALLTYVSEETPAEIDKEWNQGLQMAIEMLKNVLMLHNNQDQATTRNERRLLVKEAKKRRKYR